MRTAWNFFGAGQLRFGAGCIRQLGELAQRHTLKRVFVVSDRILSKVGYVEQVAKILATAGVATELFLEGEAEPALETAVQAAAQAKPFQPDAVLGLGGGSNMDLCKFTSLLLTHGGDPRSYFGFDQVPGPVLPIFCLPTTAGTGSEVSHASVLTDRENAIKVSTLSNWMRPTVALVDPELTYSCPPAVTADSGIDALTHAIEAITATDFDRLPVPDGESCAYEGRFPIASCLAAEAIQLVGQHLETAYAEPDNRVARDGMALAATMAGMAFSNAGVALVHSLEYPLGGALHCSHGAGNGLLLPFVMQFNLPERRETFGRIAQLLGVDTSTVSTDEAAQMAVDAVHDLKRKIGIPENIRALGGTRDQLPGFAEKAFQIKRLMWINPRQASLEELIGIYESAF